MYFDHYFLRFKAEINNNIRGILQSNQIHRMSSITLICEHHPRVMQLRDPAEESVPISSFLVPQILVLIIPPYPAVL